MLEESSSKIFLKNEGWIMSIVAVMSQQVLKLRSIY